jgi:hypothetical protein
MRICESKFQRVDVALCLGELDRHLLCRDGLLLLCSVLSAVLLAPVCHCERRFYLDVVGIDPHWPLIFGNQHEILIDLLVAPAHNAASQ